MPGPACRETLGRSVSRKARTKLNRGAQPSHMNAKSLDLVCIAVLCIILTLGLSPFHAPNNDVTWLRERNGLRFGRYGTVIGSGVFDMPHSHGGELTGSLEIWLLPVNVPDSSTFLAFSTPGDPFRFSLHQSETDLRLQFAIRNDRSRTRAVNSTLTMCFARRVRHSLRSLRARTGRRCRLTAFWPGERQSFDSPRIGSAVESSSAIHPGRPIASPVNC